LNSREISYETPMYEAWSWQPERRPRVESIELAPDAVHIATPWPELHCVPPVVTQPYATAIAPPKVVSIQVASEPVRTFGFAFPESMHSPAHAETDGSPAGGDKRPRAPANRTRIRPPGDVIKLQDRLYYLLQPPLESLLSTESLRFPFEPFAYQLDGIAFLYPRVAAILADEMGLGKTMQAISTIRLMLRLGQLRQVLLVCPKPLVTNWQREFALWAPEVPVAVIGGDRHRRQWQWALPEAPVRIANYELLLRDEALLHRSEIHFDLVVLDEAQRIKNRASGTSRVVRSIPRERSWALTGTPIENSADDLLGIFDFLCPGHLSSAMTPRRMGRAASDFILRRTKQRVLTQLPPKLYRDAEVQLAPEQRATYEQAEREGVLRLSSLGEAVTIQHVFELVLRLKQICNFDPATGVSVKFDRLAADLEEIAASGQKAIVFSQWVQTLTRLADRLAPFRPLQYHGQVPSVRRDAVLAQFRDDPANHVILMSYGAGSVGLNLQCAGYVFLFDRWWNPAVEDQAVNRAHRIGITGPVTITRFLALETIEERINQVLAEKRELFDAIIGQATSTGRLGLSREEVFGLFSLKTPPQGRSAA